MNYRRTYPRIEGIEPWLSFEELMAKTWRLNAQGYLEIRVCKNGFVFRTTQHRLVMSEQIGRALAAHEIVHHRDECKTNNSPDNLQITTRAAHALEHDGLTNVDGQKRESARIASIRVGWNHRSAERLSLVCSYCTVEFTRPRREATKSARKGRSPCCSVKCAGAAGRAAKVSHA